MKIYIATKLENWRQHQEVAAQLKVRGHEITYDWTIHGAVKEDGLPAIQAVAIADAQGVMDADVVVVLWPGGRGTHTELGIAIGCYIQVFFVSAVEEHHQSTKETCAFYHHPCVRRSKSIEEFLEQLDTYYRNEHAPD